MPVAENEYGEFDEFDDAAEELEPEADADDDVADGEEQPDAELDDGEVFTINGKEFRADEVADIIGAAETIIRQQGGTRREAQQALSQYDDDEFIRAYKHFAKQGYAPHEIVAHIANALNPRSPVNAPQQQGASGRQEEEPVFDTIEEQLEYQLNKKLADVVDPLKRQIAEMNLKAEQNRVIEHNDGVFAAALESVGVDPATVSKEDSAFLMKAKEELYPQVNIENYRYTKTMARAIVNRATELIEEQYVGKQSPRVSVARKIANSQQPPKIAPGSVGAARGAAQRGSPNQMSEAERIRAIQQLGT